ncbi:MAG: hypothetical protein HY070_02790 [Chloroflexi bacterium]|nr:hypothetical protein [Chloroflexota bacterium]MBI3741386.1 hypothetical protein [Chloroflexota bacterium]
MQKFECVLRTTPNTPSLLLKELALFYDKIFIIPPSLSAIYPSTWLELTDGNPDGKPVKPINYFRDTERMLQLPIESLQWSDPKFSELLLYLREKKIVEAADLETQNTPTAKNLNRNIKNWSRITARFDFSDPQFNALCNTKPEDYKLSSWISANLESLPTDPDPIKVTVQIIPEPKSIEISQNISESFLKAEALNAFPVFDASFRPIIEYKYRVARDTLKTLSLSSPSSQFNFDERAKLGDVLVTLSNELFRSQLIRDLDPKQLVQYRNEMEDERVKFISRNMIELLSLINSEPWTDDLQREVTKYVREKLAKQLNEYNDRSKEIWEKIHGRIIINLAKSVAWGGTAGGIASNLIPNTGPAEIVILSLIAAAPKMPGLVKDLVESMQELHSHKRNSIAYLANITRVN